MALLKHAAIVGLLVLLVLTSIAEVSHAELTATEKLIRTEIIRLGGDLEAPRFPELVAFFGDKFTEDHLELLSHLPTVRWFVVDNAPATERAFGLLQECPCLDEIRLNSPQQFDGRGLGRLVLQRNLRTLHIDDAQLSGAGFDELLTLTHLKVLTLSEVDLPVKRLAEFGKLTRLQQLMVSTTRPLDENEIEKLRAALPECDVKVSGPAEGGVDSQPSAHKSIREGMLKERADQLTPEQHESEEIQALLRKLREERQGPPWTLADVTKKSDLVVLAHCNATRLLDVDKVEDPDVKKLAEGYAEGMLELHVATMEVEAVLNGTEEEIKTLELLYPLPRPDTAILTHVDFMHLSTRLRVPVQVQVVIEGEVRSSGHSDMYHEITPLYMLMVKKCGETMYEPASGLKWPSKSIRRVLE